MANARRCGMFGIVALALFGLITTTRQASAQAQPAWLQMTIINVEPAMVDEFIALQRDISARVRRGGPAWRTVSRTDVFGDNYRFVIINPVQNLASFDARTADVELASLNSRAQKYITGQRTLAIRAMPDLDNPLPQNQAPALMMINIAKVFPGREQDYVNIMKTDFLPHFNKANFNHVSGSVTFGGETGFVHLFYMNNFAKLDEGSPVVKALGAAGSQAVTAKFSGIVTSNEQWVTRLVPELSYGPWSPAARP